MGTFKYYNVTGQTNWNRNDWKKTEWGGDPWQSDPNIPQADQRVQSDFGKQGYDRGIFVLLQTVFIQKMPMSKLSIIAI